jgi:type VII secretion integral membrane protein EccD
VPSLAYVTVDMPDRRLDIALPSGVPLAELLPTLLRAGGADLAARGPAFGGWCLRRVDGAALEPAQTLDQLRVRDGDVLILDGLDRDWPAPVVDDTAEAVADRSARRPSAAEHPVVLVGMVSVLAAAAALAVLRSGAPSTGWAAVLIAVALLLAGLRVADLPTLGLPGLVAGAAALAGSGYRGLGAAALAAGLYSLVGLVLPGSRRPVFVGGLAAAAVGLAASVAWQWHGALAGATATVGGAVLLALLAPTVAVRAGGLTAVDRDGRLDDARLGRAVTRTHETILGLVWAGALLAGAGAAALAHDGRWPSLALLGPAAAVFLLRARVYRDRAERAALVIAAGTAAIPALISVVWHGRGGPALALAAITVLLVGKLPATPSVTRLAEIAEGLAVASVVPAICLNLGLLGTV